MPMPTMCKKLIMGVPDYIETNNMLIYDVGAQLLETQSHVCW